MDARYRHARDRISSGFLKHGRVGFNERSFSSQFSNSEKVYEMSQVYRALEKAEREKQEEQRGRPPLGIFKQEIISNRQKTTVKIPEQWRERLDLPAKEEVPILIPSPNSFGGEQFRKLRTQILLHSPHPHTILVTSAVPQEGKTLVSVNLAVSIAQTVQNRVILIDADLRRPSIHFPGLREKKGLSDYLTHQASLSEILLRPGEENLGFIPAGSPTSKASELLGSKRLGDLLVSLKEFGQETYVIIDSPPILLSSETSLLSRAADAVVFVVRADRTQKELVQRAIKATDIEKVIGIVLNQIDPRPSSYHDYSGYYNNLQSLGRKKCSE
jgi:protein-tyrosine kinase